MSISLLLALGYFRKHYPSLHRQSIEKFHATNDASGDEFGYRTKINVDLVTFKNAPVLVANVSVLETASSAQFVSIK